MMLLNQIAPSFFCVLLIHLYTSFLQVMARLAYEFRMLSEDWKMGVDNGGHSWAGPPLADAYVDAFQQRLEEVC